MTIKQEPIKPGIRNTFTGEVLTPQVYRQRRDLDLHFNRQMYELSAKQIMVLHAELIQPLTVK